MYSASNPWSVSLVEQLENAFQGRIEFRSSDGTDPYVPTQPTTAPTVQPTQPQWNTPTESPTQETFWATQLPTTPVYTEPVVTQPVTVPVYTEPATVPTLPVQTLPQNTQPTIVLGAQATTPPTYFPESGHRRQQHLRRADCGDYSGHAGYRRAAGENRKQRQEEGQEGQEGQV